MSDDNLFSEALFRTANYRPEYPHGLFTSLEAGREWSTWFVGWYNEEHLHSGIRFVTLAQRHHEPVRASLLTPLSTVSP